MNFNSIQPYDRNMTYKQRPSIPPLRTLCLAIGLAVIMSGITPYMVKKIPSRLPHRSSLQ
jgi:hypothetical protein